MPNLFSTSGFPAFQSKFNNSIFQLNKSEHLTKEFISQVETAIIQNDFDILCHLIKSNSWVLSDDFVFLFELCEKHHKKELLLAFIKENYNTHFTTWNGLRGATRLLLNLELFKAVHELVLELHNKVPCHGPFDMSYIYSNDVVLVPTFFGNWDALEYVVNQIGKQASALPSLFGLSLAQALESTSPQNAMETVDRVLRAVKPMLGCPCSDAELTNCLGICIKNDIHIDVVEKLLSTNQYKVSPLIYQYLNGKSEKVINLVNDRLIDRLANYRKAYNRLSQLMPAELKLVLSYKSQSTHHKSCQLIHLVNDFRIVKLYVQAGLPVDVEAAITKKRIVTPLLIALERQNYRKACALVEHSRKMSADECNQFWKCSFQVFDWGRFWSVVDNNLQHDLLSHANFTYLAKRPDDTGISLIPFAVAKMTPTQFQECMKRKHPPTGMNVLHLLVRWCTVERLKALQLLLRKGGAAFVDERDSNGNTPLMLAVRCQLIRFTIANRDVAKELLKHGAVISQRNNAGNTVFAFMKREILNNLVEYILERFKVTEDDIKDILHMVVPQLPYHKHFIRPSKRKMMSAITSKSCTDVTILFKC